MRIYWDVLRIFWATDARASHKLRSVFWVVYYQYWIENLFILFHQQGLDYIFALRPQIFFMFRVRTFILKKVEPNFIFERIVGHYQSVDQYFGRQGVQTIHQDGLLLSTITIADKKIEIFGQYLNWSSNEGLFSVRLLLNQQIFYFAHLHFYQGAMWIGGFQGVANQLELAKQFTKGTKGVRPQNFMYFILTLLAERLGLDAIYAVSSDQHYYQKKQKTCQQVKFNYDEFWSELSGQPTSDGVWFELPIIYPRKNISEIPSKKRSQYNQRYAWMDQVAADFRKES